MTERKHIFQVVSKKDGTRSPVACCSRREFAEYMYDLDDELKRWFLRVGIGGCHGW